MPYKFFTIPLHDAGDAAAELNAFLGSHKVLSVDRRWIDLGENSFWSFCVDYLAAVPSGTRGDGTGGKRPKIDYKEVLSPEEFTLFAQLRDLRKEMAQRDAVPVYAIFTNEQLAQMVQTKATSKADLGKIEGIGNARVEKYGPRVLELLSIYWNKHDEKSGEPV